MRKPKRKFKTGTLVKGVPFSSEFVQSPMMGIIIEESSRSNWWGDYYARWYWILTENGKLVEEVEKYLEEL